MQRHTMRRVLTTALALVTFLEGASASAGLRGPSPQTPELERAAALNKQAEDAIREGEFDEALRLARSALAIREKALGPHHAEVARSLSNVAAAHRAKGQFTTAEQLYQRALSIFERTPGAQSPDYAKALNNLGTLDIETGNYVRAETRLLRALEVYEKALGPEHLLVAAASNNLGELYKKRGNLEKSVQLHRRALGIREKALGAEHLLVSRSLNNLAVAYDDMGDTEQAEPLYKRSLAIIEKELGKDHPDAGLLLNNLATLYAEKGDLASAEPLLRRSLEITEKAFGPDHPEVAAALHNLADLHRERGDYDAAESLFLRSLKITEEAFGPTHPDAAETLSNLSALYMAKDEPAKAVATQTRANEIRESNLALILPAGSEDEKRLYLRTLSGETDGTVSLLTRYAPADEAAARLAATTVLRRKGRVLDVMANSVGALRRRMNDEDRALLEKLSAARARLASLTLQSPEETTPEERRAAVRKIETETERLEGVISARNPEYRAQSQPVTLERVQGAIPEGAALVEMMLYHPYRAKGTVKRAAEREGPLHYVAFVLTREGAPRWIELGEASQIGQAVAQFRAALGDPRNADVRRLARALDERVMRPVRRLLAGARMIFLSPDGALNLVPFGALVDEHDRYLVESYSFTYLTSGRDLLRLGVRGQGAAEVVVVAAPAFDTAVGGRRTQGSVADATRGAAVLRRMRWPPLEGTAEEANAIRRLLPGARVLRGTAATEAAFKQLAGPRILHVATHGFFLPDSPEREAVEGAGRDDAPAAESDKNPMLRSGLILAGANRHQSGNGEDGILTALEAASLHLWGTRLVVLSACETGVGDVLNGEGVYGLRRALVLAGSESQVMSLWQVRDAAVTDLMVKYYTRLKAGEGRTEALRQVQLDTLNSPARRHPYFWASFIQSGAWSGVNTRSGRKR